MPSLWNPELIARYDLSGPRYTSYPTAPQFSEAFGETDLKTAIQRSNISARPLSLYFHIPFCDTVCYYCACNKIITANKTRARPYLDRLIKEIEMTAANFDNRRPVTQLHWGGGTPTYISDDEKRELMAATRKHFNLLDDDSGEYSIEIHPGRMTVDTIPVLRDIGFNRISMGVQDFDPDVQKAVNRFNSVEEVSALMDAIHREGFHSVSMDLIYGLPMQTMETLKRTLEQTIKLNPDRLSLFNYAHMPNLFKVQKQIDESQLPEPQVKLQMLEYAISRLTEAGYVYIGMDHFAKPDDELTIAQQKGKLQRNFQGYATHGGCDMVAMGVSAISAINNVYAQNFKDIESYQSALDNDALPVTKGFTLNDDDILRKTVINKLICHFKLSFKEIEDEFDIKFTDYFSESLERLKPLAEDDLIRLDADSITVNDGGRLLIRSICMMFDAYLKPNSEVRYSRII
ncbi:MAG: oxygen-independent coproporphyrinogen III oxidase [Pseudomonadales bacterium]